MKYLLDTHTAIWALADDAKLSNASRELIGDTSNSLSVSIVSAWEMAIKVGLKKLDFEGGVRAFLSELENNGIDILGVEGLHVQCVESLPWIHRDPFDRLLIATALTEDMTILTADENVQRYAVKWIW